jgi:hypothetical protein
LKKVASETEAWVNGNEKLFLVAKQRLLAKSLYIDGSGAFKCVVGERATFEVRRKAGLQAGVSIALLVDLRDDANQPVPCKIEPISDVPGARRVSYTIGAGGVYTCNVYAVPGDGSGLSSSSSSAAATSSSAAPPAAPNDAAKIDVSGSPFLIQANEAGGRGALPDSIEFIDFIKGMPLSVFQGASEENPGSHQQRLDARLKALGLKSTVVPLDADCN